MINLSPGQRAIKAASRYAWVKLLISGKQYTAIYYFEIPVLHRKNPKSMRPPSRGVSHKPRAGQGQKRGRFAGQGSTAGKAVDQVSERQSISKKQVRPMCLGGCASQ
nr:hypothetical protein [Alcaligenes faecalis]